MGDLYMTVLDTSAAYIRKLKVERDEYKQAAAAEAQLADEYKTDRDRLVNAVRREHFPRTDGPHGDCLTCQALRAIDRQEES